jgi:hypothetical protein
MIGIKCREAIKNYIMNKLRAEVSNVTVNKCNSQTNDGLSAPGNKRLWTLQENMVRRNFGDCSRPWDLVLDTGELKNNSEIIYNLRVT